MEAQRRPLYRAAADAVVPNTARWRMLCGPPWRLWMKFLILNGPNVNLTALLGAGHAR